MYTIFTILLFGSISGLLHSLDNSDDDDLKLNFHEIETLLVRCSNDPVIAVRSEAAMELIELISGSHDKDDSEDDVENEDFNDNNIK